MRFTYYHNKVSLILSKVKSYKIYHMIEIRVEHVNPLSLLNVSLLSQHFVRVKI